jgi:hypothetical protein
MLTFGNAEVGGKSKYRTENQENIGFRQTSLFLVTLAWRLQANLLSAALSLK